MTSFQLGAVGLILYGGSITTPSLTWTGGGVTGGTLTLTGTGTINTPTDSLADNDPLRCTLANDALFVNNGTLTVGGAGSWTVGGGQCHISNAGILIFDGAGL